MAEQVVTILVACRGAGDTYEQAERHAVNRLDNAAAAIKDGRRPRDPGVQHEELDPGGGPCTAKQLIEILTGAHGLPEAQQQDDDD